MMAIDSIVITKEGIDCITIIISNHKYPTPRSNKDKPTIKTIVNTTQKTITVNQITDRV
jgi:hypothetical protein